MVNAETRDMNALKLTVADDGVVWYLEGSSLPRSSGHSVPEFMKSGFVKPHHPVRVPGFVGNAELLKLLYEIKILEECQTLEVCSPVCCESAVDRKDPAVLLHCLRRFHLPPSLGGWHHFAIKDYTSYTLAHHYATGGGYDEHATRLTIAHPAWPAMSFVGSIQQEAFSHLVAAILDPRWFVDPWGDPNQTDRLERYLGVVGKTEAGGRGARFKLVKDCWKLEGQPQGVYFEPRDFLWRLWTDAGGGDKGDLIACKQFVELLRLTWLQSMHLGNQGSHLFVPEHFFTTREEIECFGKHMSLFA